MKKLGIQKKIYITFAAFATILVLTFGIIMAGYLLVNEVRDTKKSVQMNLSMVAEQFERLTKEMYQIGKTVSENKEIQRTLKTTPVSEQEKYQNDVLQSMDLLYISKYFNENMNVYVLGENGNLFKSGYLSWQKDDFSSEEWYMTVKESKDIIWFDLHQGSYVASSLDDIYISLGIPIRDAKTNRFLGTVLVELKADDIFADYMAKEKEKLYIIHTSDEMSIENDLVKFYEEKRFITLDGMVETYDSKTYCPAYVRDTVDNIYYWQKDFQSQGSMETMKYHTNYVQVNTTEWIFVYIIPKAELYSGVILIAIVSVTIILGGLFVTLLFSQYISNSLTRPIRLLRESAAAIAGGNLDVQVPKITDDEIGELSDQFNVMVRSLKDLLKRVYEEQEARRASEMMLLQAQINPHFLYNTLDSLQWLIRMKQREDAEKMTSALTQFFKTGLNSGKDMITLEKEVENVESYLTIQKLRYKSKLTYFIYLDEKAGSRKVPKLILQPLVENALYHGIKPKEEGGFIDIHVCMEKGRIHISVIDDGCGMEEEKLEILRRSICEGKVEQEGSYGLKNVNERLCHFFREGYEMRIESSPGLGTSVNIFLNEEAAECSDL